MTAPTLHAPVPLPAAVGRTRSGPLGQRYWQVFALLALVYVAAYGLLLASSRGVPYVLDNNESLSVFVQAKNLLNYPLAASAGLADESLAPDAAAHPFVYTHGGELARFFAAGLDVLGITSIEAQIAVTTILSGLLGLYLMYRFFSRSGGLVLASIVCLVFFSDYLLVAQWQVNMWRVWQTALLFGALVCVQSARSGMPARRQLVTAALGFCLFYYYVVFGVFVVATVALFGLWAHPARWRVALASSAWMTRGALVASIVLAAQRIAYLGWNDALTDLFLTYSARLHAAGAPSDLSALQAFYGSHHIVFWYDLVDGRAFSTVSAFIGGIFHYGFQVPTPLFSLIVLLLATGAVLGSASWLDGKHRSAVPERRGIPGPLKAASLCVAWFAALLVIFSGNLILGTPPPVRWTFVIWDGSLRALGLASLGAVLATLSLGRLVTGERHFERLPAARVFASVGLLTAVAVAVRLQYYLYDQGQSIIWLELFPARVPLWCAQVAVVAATGVAVATTLSGTSSLRARLGGDASGALAFVAAAFGAYTLLYAVAGGNLAYAFTLRYAPLLVYFVDVVVGVAIFALLTSATNAARHAVSGAPGRVVATFAAIASASLCTCMLGYWALVQSFYVTQLPPSLFGFVAVLGQPPLAGASFVVNNDGALAGAFTHQWAYYDPVIAGGVTKAGYIVARDSQSYTWFADRDVNPVYTRPAYFLCVLPETLTSLAVRLQNQDRPLDRCSALPLVRGAVQRPETFPHTLVARDASGHDAWAIVQLNPNFQLEPGQTEAPSPDGDLAEGANWYPLETFGGQSFQWIDNDAEIVATAPLSGQTQLRVDVEPGPGLGSRDVVLQLRDQLGNTVASAPVAGRQVVNLPLPLEQGATSVFRLHVDGGGRPTPGDWRTLNFRVFSFDWVAG